MDSKKKKPSKTTSMRKEKEKSSKKSDKKHDESLTAVAELSHNTEEAVTKADDDVEKMDEDQVNFLLAKYSNEVRVSSSQLLDKPLPLKKYLLSSLMKHMKQEDNDENKASFYLTKLKSADSRAQLLSHIESLRVQLKGCTLSWIKDFNNENNQGLRFLGDCLSGRTHPPLLPEDASAIVKCVRAFANFQYGLEEVGKDDELITYLLHSMDPTNAVLMEDLLSILSGVIYFNSESFERVLRSLNRVQKMKGRPVRERFYPVIATLSNENSVMTALIFLELLLYHQTENSHENMILLQNHLRLELIRLGLNEALVKLTTSSTARVKDKAVSLQDRLEGDISKMQIKVDEARTNLCDASELMRLLYRNVCDTPLENYFLSVLHHLLVVLKDQERFAFICGIIENLTLLNEVKHPLNLASPEDIASLLSIDDLLDRLPRSNQEWEIKYESLLVEKQELGLKLEKMAKQLKENPTQASSPSKGLKIPEGLFGSSVHKPTEQECESGGSSIHKNDQNDKSPKDSGLGDNGSQVTIPPPPPLPGFTGAEIPPPLPFGTTGGIPPPPPIPATVGIPPPPPLPGMVGIPPPPPLPGMVGIPPPPPLPGMGGIPPPPAPPGIGGIPPPPPPPGMGGIPPPPPPPGMGGIPPPPPPPGMGGIPPPPPPPGMGGIPPPPPPPGMGGIPPPPPPPGMGGGIPPPPPPPGMGGGIPPPPGGIPAMSGAPPPPPGGGFGFFNSAPKIPHGIKVVNVPKSDQPMKRVQWSPLGSDKVDKSSVWVKVNPTTLLDDALVSQMAESFSMKSSKPPPSLTNSSMSSDVQKKKTKQLQVLDGKTAQNLSIVLGSMKLPYTEWKRRILEIDEALNASMIEQLIKALPSAEEITSVSNIKQPYEDLLEAEQFVFTVGSIKKLHPRLEAMLFRICFAARVADVKPDLATGMEALKEVLTSSTFMKVIEFVLVIGNVMNAGTKNANCFAFDIKVLPKLSDTKDKENKHSLLNFMALKLVEKYPNIAPLAEELSSVDRAVRISVDTIKANIAELKQGIRKVELDLKSYKSQAENDNYVSKMTAFVEENSNQLEILDAMFEQMEKKFKEVSSYLSFDANKYHMEEFFQDLKQFKDLFTKAVQDNEVEKERERKAQAAKEKEVEMAASKAKSSSSTAAVGGDPNRVLDNLMEALKAGNITPDATRGAKRRAQNAARPRVPVARSRSRLLEGSELNSTLVRSTA